MFAGALQRLRIKRETKFARFIKCADVKIASSHLGLYEKLRGPEFLSSAPSTPRRRYARYLDEERDLARLAEIARLSPSHWRRLYRAFYDETIAATARRLRLHRAAGDLVESPKPIATIALAAGCDNVAAFFARLQIRLWRVIGAMAVERPFASSHQKRILLCTT